MAIGICICVGMLLWARRAERKLLIRLIGLAAVALAAWGVRTVIDLFKSRDDMSFVDSTGATVLATVALLAAITATVLGVATIWFARDVSGRTAVCAFLVVAVAATSLTYKSVQDHRRGVWHPDLTAVASPPVSVPDGIGPVRYEVPLVKGSYSPDIYPAGNGFIVDTREGVTAYDGTNGEKRWHAGDFGTSGRLFVVRRDRDDAVGIVALFLYGGLVAFDGSSGEVLWRRELSQGGKVTAATGSVDALGMAVFTADAPEVDNSRTSFHSIDPATGRDRWSKPISCSNPTVSPGTPGQFGIDCGKPEVMDAHTGDTVDVPGEYTPIAGSDVYVASDLRPHQDPTPSDVTRVFSPDGQVIDEIPATYPISVAHEGNLLVYGGGDTWLLRDYRNHRSTPLPLHVDTRFGLDTIRTTWLDKSLVITTDYEIPQRLQTVDLLRPTDTPVEVESPCPRDESMRGLMAVAGAVIAQCGNSYVAGLVPGRG
ncbi:PQQ-binding-like beta-propeller repeat protein [Mycobacterium sp. NPDC050441]|uniref:outer membrane protein assembly factor BamB family protein n=1 Tax=Mycobacterium sp. NPDC050441 TaxID=3155403 RepID=UPI0033DC78A1